MYQQILKNSSLPGSSKPRTTTLLVMLSSSLCHIALLLPQLLPTDILLLSPFSFCRCRVMRNSDTQLKEPVNGEQHVARGRVKPSATQHYPKIRLQVS